MSSAYLKIRNISSLDYILNYLKTIENKKDIIVFLDWDDTLVNPDNDKLIEAEITKELFKYMIDNRIFYAIITGRFYDTVCDDKKRNVFEIQNNIQKTIKSYYKCAIIPSGRPLVIPGPNSRSFCFAISSYLFSQFPHKAIVILLTGALAVQLPCFVQ